jgi:hypothetical protein
MVWRRMQAGPPGLNSVDSKPPMRKGRPRFPSYDEIRQKRLESIESASHGDHRYMRFAGERIFVYLLSCPTKRKYVPQKHTQKFKLKSDRQANPHQYPLPITSN